MKIGQVIRKAISQLPGPEEAGKTAMWYVKDTVKTLTMSSDDSGKISTIAHGKWKGERVAFLKVTG